MSAAERARAFGVGVGWLWLTRPTRIEVKASPFSDVRIGDRGKARAARGNLLYVELDGGAAHLFRARELKAVS